DQLRTWDWAPENPAVIQSGAGQIALTTYALSDRKKFRANLQLAVERGLSEEAALAALTIQPARLSGLEDRLGTIEPGKLANLTVVEGSYFVPTNKVHQVWVNGRVHHVQKDGERARPMEKEHSEIEEQ